MEKRLKGFKTYRHVENPKEEELHDEFVLRFSGSKNLDYIIFGQDSTYNVPKDYLSDREKRIVVSTVQWLGTPSGQGFLRSLGYCEMEEFTAKEHNWTSKLACLEQQLAKIPKWIKAIFK